MRRAAGLQGRICTRDTSPMDARMPMSTRAPDMAPTPVSSSQLQPPGPSSSRQGHIPMGGVYNIRCCHVMPHQRDAVGPA
eukprot:3014660-Pyramimonas_sp.AAC.1